jgi:DNA-binding GntR family transcriptional regulator
MEQPGVDPSEFDRLNMEFHLAVVASSGNEVIVRVMRLLREALSGYLPDLLARVTNPRGTLERMVEEHRAILTSIAEGNATLAASLAQSHVEGAYQAERDKDDLA